MEAENNDLFVRSVLSTRVVLPFQVIGNNYLDILREHIANAVEGKCIADGYVKRNSVDIVHYSSGKIVLNMVEFQVTYQCDLFLPVEGMLLPCITKKITQKAGIHAECIHNNYPIASVFVSRDDNLSHPSYHEIKEQMPLTVRVSGVLFELNDTTITIIAELI